MGRIEEEFFYSFAQSIGERIEMPASGILTADML